MNEHADPKRVITVSTAEAKSRLSELLSRAERGETIQVSRHGKIVAEISAAGSRNRKPLWGSLEGRAWISPDFDAPLEEFAEYS